MAPTVPNPILLEQAIATRLQAAMDHADIDVTVQGVAAHMAGSVMEAKWNAAPFIVFDLLRGDFVGTLAADGISATYRVTIHDHPDNAGNGNAAKAFEGLWGNWHPIDNQTPDYGLHMWSPSVLGQDSSSFVGRRYTTPHTPDALNYQIIFDVLSHNEE